MEKVLTWDIEELKTLFKYVEIKKSEGVALIKIFDNFARYVGRGQNSVRNFYYQTLKNLKQDLPLCKKLGINIASHEAKEVEAFSSEQTKSLIQNVDKLVLNGYSVRGACLKLAGGNATKMIRIQNKYRSEKKQNMGENMGNIIKMPAKNIMSDEDISALFMGLVKLVKRQEQEKARVGFENELQLANQKLKKALKDIILKQAQIDKLQTEISLLKEQENNNEETAIKQRVQNLNQNNAKNLIKEFVFKRQLEEKPEQNVVKKQNVK